MTKFWQVADATPQSWPVQRCITAPDAMAMSELLQQICGIGLTQAQRIIETVCGQSNWTMFREVSATELQQAGLSQRQAVKLLAALELGKRAYSSKQPRDNIGSQEKAATALLYDLGFSSVEKFAILIMDAKLNLIAKEVISIGSADQCIADPKIVFERILRNQGSQYILAHCHLSGDPTPSKEDIDLTKQFIQASEMMNLKLIDHIVIAADDYASIRYRHPEFGAMRMKIS